MPLRFAWCSLVIFLPLIASDPAYETLSVKIISRPSGLRTIEIDGAERPALIMEQGKAVIKDLHVDNSDTVQACLTYSISPMRATRDAYSVSVQHQQGRLMSQSAEQLQSVR